MARITPSSGSNFDFTKLEDDEPYKGIVTKPKEGWLSKGSPEYGGEDRLTIDWQLSQDPADNVRDWISLRLGKQQNGTVSKLRMLLNALSDKPRDTEIKWFDSDTMEWGYDEKPFNVITEGMEVIFRGVHGTKQDGTGKFTIQKYSAPKGREGNGGVPVTAGAKPTAPTSAAKKLQKADESEIPF